MPSFPTCGASLGDTVRRTDEKKVEQGLKLEQFVEARLSLLWLHLGVGEVQEAEYELEPTTRHQRAEVIAVEWPGLAPV